MWADQAAIRAGISKSAWNKIRQRAPPTEDLLLYAIAASVLQRRKQILEKYNSMDEIVRECNNMEGQLDVWKLLEDAHDLNCSHGSEVSALGRMPSFNNTIVTITDVRGWVVSRAWPSPIV
nr:GTPase-activating protein GYP7-like isoform X2 [Tanacetum cinerariifolium]